MIRAPRARSASASMDASGPSLPRRCVVAFRIGGWVNLALALLLAAIVLRQAESAAGAERARRREQSESRLSAARQHMESYLAHVGVVLQMIRLDPGALVADGAARERIQSVFEALHARHQLAEVYVLERDFDGRRRPLITCELGDAERSADELHDLRREASEYAVQIEQIQRLAAEPSRDSIVSSPVELCVGGPGLVYSVPIRRGPALLGMVAGMIPLETLARELDASAIGRTLELSLAERPIARVPRGRLAESSGGARLSTEIDGPGDERWRLHLLDTADAAVGSGAAARWLLPILIALLGGALCCLCQFAPTLLRARHFAEHARRREAELAHLSRLATVSEMASGLAHELGQPLVAISAHAEAVALRVESGGAAGDELLEDLRCIQQEAQRAGQIVRFVRAFMQPYPAERTRADLNELVLAVGRFLAGELARAGVQLRCELGAELPDVWVAPIAIEQVLVNLLRNAREAMERQSDPSPAITVATLHARSAGEVVCEIRDNGPGLPPAQAARVFEPFNTSKPGGLGLGLSISRTLVEAHGGRLTWRAGDGRGACFALALPEYPGDLPRPVPARGGA